jgi:hypothetical protein
MHSSAQHYDVSFSRDRRRYKGVPVTVCSDDSGSKSLRFDTEALLAIGTEAGFKGRTIKELAQEDMERAAAVDPDLDSSMQLDASMDIILAVPLPRTLSPEERAAVLHDLQSQGHEAEVRELEEA